MPALIPGNHLLNHACPHPWESSHRPCLPSYLVLIPKGIISWILPTHIPWSSTVYLINGNRLRDPIYLPSSHGPHPNLDIISCIMLDHVLFLYPWTSSMDFLDIIYKSSSLVLVHNFHTPVSTQLFVSYTLPPWPSTPLVSLVFNNPPLHMPPPPPYPPPPTYSRVSLLGFCL